VSPKARDVVTFFLGFAGMVHQTVVAPAPQVILVVMFTAMLIGPFALQAVLDRWQNK
jgi:uncharacterized membrane protein YccC